MYTCAGWSELGAGICAEGLRDCEVTSSSVHRSTDVTLMSSLGDLRVLLRTDVTLFQQLEDNELGGYNGDGDPGGFCRRNSSSVRGCIPLVAPCLVQVVLFLYAFCEPSKDFSVRRLDSRACSLSQADRAPFSSSNISSPSRKMDVRKYDQSDSRSSA